MTMALLSQQNAAVARRRSTALLQQRRRVAPLPDTRIHPIVRGVTLANVTDQGTHYPFPAADLSAPEGTPIYAPENCTSFTGLYQHGGYTATLFGIETSRWYYLAHGDREFLAGGQRKGTQIGAVGSTGTGPGGYAASGGTDPHLHLALSSDGDFSRGDRGGSGDLWPTPDLWEMTGTRWPRYDGGTVTRDEIEGYYYQATILRAMNWDHVRIVVNGEGGFNEPTLRNYAGEPAWGSLQLHVVAEDYRAGFEEERAIAQADPCQGYVGDQFICHTGLHPSEVRAWKMAADFGLDYAVRAGTWAAWYGARGLPGGRFTRTGGHVAGFSEEAQAYAGLLA